RTRHRIRTDAYTSATGVRPRALVPVVATAPVGLGWIRALTCFWVAHSRGMAVVRSVAHAACAAILRPRRGTTGEQQCEQRRTHPRGGTGREMSRRRDDVTLVWAVGTHSS